jgi:hypothetical protein
MKTNNRIINRRAAWLLASLVVMVISCGKDNDKPNPDPGTNPGKNAPEITSFSLGNGMPATDVVIKGKNFGAMISQNEVRFKGATLAAVIKAASPTEITASVPTDAITGKLIVKTNNGSDTTDTEFVVDPEVARITDFSPKQGMFGTQVTITGRMFSNDITVKINGIEAQKVTWSGTQIVFKIPFNTTLTSHKITVTSGSDNLETAENFTVTQLGPYATWQKKNITFVPENLSVFSQGLSFVYKNKIYWGFTALSISENVADYVVFDPAQPGKGWELQNHPPADMAPAKLQGAVAVVHNNRVFMGTGIAPTASNKWFEFFPETNTAAPLTNFPEAVMSAVSFVLNNQVYVGFGGTNKKLYKFNPAGNNNQGSWDLAATAPFSELNSGNAFVLGNEVFLARVLPSVLQSRNATYRFTESGQFTQMTDMFDDVQTLKSPVFTIGDKGYLVIQKNVWEYKADGSGGAWRPVINRTDSPTIIHTAVVTVNGAQVIYGWTSSGSLYEFKF